MEQSDQKQNYCRKHTNTEWFF